ncbi:hypothetical protein JRQ81_014510 [Phrynocephalus forsythii]|uniref:WD repeat-containing protein on Y chromosome n=1 Tax=Phrynocephalus forsythii TaxID=171643 RepID=A0A9Q0XXV7_9SAUR|nr:hypothetical protein JRQ81_014510 [Phrynocephalus forsythii]
MAENRFFGESGNGDSHMVEVHGSLHLVVDGGASVPGAKQQKNGGMALESGKIDLVEALLNFPLFLLDQTKRRHSLKLWVIDMLCLPNINLLAIATTDQDIGKSPVSSGCGKQCGKKVRASKIHTRLSAQDGLNGNKCDRIFTLVDLDGCATAMDYWDIKEHEKVIECKHWKSYHSDDILCMDGHRNKLLVTASCSGDIVLWNVNTGQAFCRFNASEGPLSLLPKREFSVGPDSPKKATEFSSSPGKKCWAYSRTGLPSKAALPTRPVSAQNPAVSSFHCKPPGTALPGSRLIHPQAAVSSEGGKKSANSPQAPGAAGAGTPSKKDRPTWQEEVSATQVAVEKVSFIGCRSEDIQGRMKSVLETPGLVYKATYRLTQKTYKGIVLCIMERRDPALSVRVFSLVWQVHHGWVTTLVPPPCLSSWRGHLKNVVSIKYVERFRVILTASHDCTIKLWMLSGKHIGTFGQSLWKLGMQQLMPAEVPEDIRRVASLHTMIVLNEGRRPHWESTRNIFHALSQQKRQESMLMDFLHVKPGLARKAANKMRELISKETRMAKYTEEQIEASFQKWEESGKQKSEILGRAYKQKVHRPLLKQLPEVKAFVANKDQPRIYHCIQYTDLHPMVAPHIPDILAESQQAQAVAEHRAGRRVKGWSTLTGMVIKPTLKNYLIRKKAMRHKESGSKDFKRGAEGVS